MAESMRIHRALARAGVASRRVAESLVAAGRVSINGAPAKTGQSVTLGRDRVAVDGNEVELVTGAATWIVLNKPAGVVTTARDPQGRRTVFDLVEAVPGLTYVGRLDFLTEGLVILTTDGEAANRLSHPSGEVDRVYVATVTGNVKRAAEAARAGVELEDGIARAEWVNVRPLGDRRWEFEIALREGRNREVRRLCAAVELEVERLVRTQYGPVTLGKLSSGASRPLTARERALLQEDFGITAR